MILENLNVIFKSMYPLTDYLQKVRKILNLTAVYICVSANFKVAE